MENTSQSSAADSSASASANPNNNRDHYLQRIRPPPLAQISNHPPPLLNNAAGPRPSLPHQQQQQQFPPLNTGINPPFPPLSATSAFLQRPSAPLSPLPPFPTGNAAVESPISAYIRYLQNSMSSVDPKHTHFSGSSPLASLLSPRWNSPAPPPPQFAPAPQTTTATATVSSQPLSSQPLLQIPPKVVLNLVFPLTNFVLEIVLVILDQIRSAQKPLYSLITLVVALSAMMVCLGELVYKGRHRNITLKWNGMIWKIEKQLLDSRPFFTRFDAFSLICAISQLVFATVGYSYSRQHKENPIKVSLVSLSYIICMGASHIVNKSIDDDLSMKRNE